MAVMPPSIAFMYTAKASGSSVMWNDPLHTGELPLPMGVAPFSSRSVVLSPPSVAIATAVARPAAPAPTTTTSYSSSQEMSATEVAASFAAFCAGFGPHPANPSAAAPNAAMPLVLMKLRRETMSFCSMSPPVVRFPSREPCFARALRTLRCCAAHTGYDGEGGQDEARKGVNPWWECRPIRANLLLRALGERRERCLVR